MSWKIAGIICSKIWQPSNEDLLKQLNITYQNSGIDFTYWMAINRDNFVTAVGTIYNQTHLLHHFLTYDCAFEPGQETDLDNLLAELSQQADILAFIVDTVPSWYSFTHFSQGKKNRCWAVNDNAIFCNEGDRLSFEQNNPPKLESIFPISEHEEYFFAAIESFGNFNFQEAIQSEEQSFQFFL